MTRKLSVGAVVGAAIGGLTVIALVSGLLLCYRRKAQDQSKLLAETHTEHQPSPAGLDRMPASTPEMARLSSPSPPMTMATVPNWLPQISEPYSPISYTGSTSPVPFSVPG